jgi:lipopolysaccharide export system permease protein
MLFTKIDRYLSAMFWLYFVGALVVFISLFLVIDAMSFLVINSRVEFSLIVKYYGYSVPEIAYRMFPVASLVATVFTLTTIQKSNELLALFSFGQSLVRISAPLIFWILVLSFGAFKMSDTLLPQFYKKKLYVQYVEIEKKPGLYSTIKDQKIWYRSKNTIFNIKTLNTQNQKAEGLTMYFFNEAWDLVQMIFAKEIYLSGENWLLKDGSVTLFSEDSSFPLTSQFKQKKIVMSEDAKDLGSAGSASQMLTVSELKSFINKNKEAGLDTVRYQVDYHSKFGFAFSALVMCMLGIPFTVGKARSGGVMVNIGLCMLLVFVYWIFYSSALSLGNYAYISAVLAGWAPNVIMLIAALFLIKKTRK